MRKSCDRSIGAAVCSSRHSLQSRCQLFFDKLRHCIALVWHMSWSSPVCSSRRKRLRSSSRRSLGSLLSSARKCSIVRTSRLQSTCSVHAQVQTECMLKCSPA